MIYDVIYIIKNIIKKLYPRQSERSEPTLDMRLAFGSICDSPPARYATRLRLDMRLDYS